MDLSELLLLSAALGGIGAVAQHFWDRYAPTGLYRRTARIAETAPARIGSEVEAGLNRVFAAQKAEIEAASKQAEEAFNAQALSAQQSIVRGLGVEKQFKGKVDRLLGEAILGPAMPLLRQFAPGLADALEENPQLIDVVIQNPLFRKYVAPRIEQYLGAMGAESQPVDTGSGWGR